MQIFYARTIKGNLRFDNSKALSDYLCTVEGKPLVVRIDKETWKRTDNQNRFYWAYLRIIADQTGHTEDDLHSLFKRLFLPPVYKKILNTEVKLPASTTDLNKAEFGDYMDKIAAHTDVPVPDPKLLSDYLSMN